MEEFYTVNQAALVLKVHHLTIRRYIKEGKLKAVRVGGNVRISVNELKAFTQSFIPQTRSTKSQATPSEATFSLNDPLFRLKARGVSMNRLKREE